MYDYLIGNITEKSKNALTIEVNSIGYRCIVSDKTLQKLETNRVKLYIHFLVREDLQQLYGFHDALERQVFLLLSKVSGVGPKTSIAILSALDVSTLQRAVLDQNSNIFSQVSGVGKKTALKLSLELKDLLPKISIVPSDHRVEKAVAALINLGFQPSIAREKAYKASSKHGSVEKIVTAVLSDR